MLLMKLLEYFNNWIIKIKIGTIGAIIFTKRKPSISKNIERSDMSIKWVDAVKLLWKKTTSGGWGLHLENTLFYDIKNDTVL